MKLHSVFLGKAVHWLPWPIIGAVFIWMNSEHLHVTRFNVFASVLLGMAAGIVAFLRLTSRPGEQITREAIPQEGGIEGTAGED